MGKIKDSASLFVIVNAALLYIIYFLIRNFDIILHIISGAVCSFISALSPLLTGILIAYLVAPLSDFIDEKFAKRFIKEPMDDPVKKARFLQRRYFVSILLALALIIIFMAVFIYAFAVLISGTLNVGSLYESVESIVQYWSSLKSAVYDAMHTLPEGKMRDTAFRIYERLLSYITRSISPERLISLISDIGSILIDIGIGIIVSIYLLKDKEYFIRMWRKLLHITLPQKANAVITETLHDINNVLSLFLRGAVVDSLIFALIASAIFSVYGLPFSVFTGCFAGMTNIIPYFGPFIGAVPAVITGIFSGGIARGIGAAVILLIIQQIDCNIIYPKIVGGAAGLHPLFVLLSVSIFGHYGGILGMIVAVPLAGIVKVLVMKIIPS